MKMQKSAENRTNAGGLYIFPETPRDIHRTLRPWIVQLIVTKLIKACQALLQRLEHPVRRADLGVELAEEACVLLVQALAVLEERAPHLALDPRPGQLEHAFEECRVRHFLLERQIAQEVLELPRVYLQSERDLSITGMYIHRRQDLIVPPPSVSTALKRAAMLELRD